jgi:hypothetical protein
MPGAVGPTRSRRSSCSLPLRCPVSRGKIESGCRIPNLVHTGHFPPETPDPAGQSDTAASRSPVTLRPMFPSARPYISRTSIRPRIRNHPPPPTPAPAPHRRPPVITAARGRSVGQGSGWDDRMSHTDRSGRGRARWETARNTLRERGNRGSDRSRRGGWRCGTEIPCQCKQWRSEPDDAHERGRSKWRTKHRIWWRGS